MSRTGSPAPRTAADPHPRSQIDFPEGEGLAKQSFQAECDINNIMAKYQRTGVIDHYAAESPRYGYATSQDFREAMQLVIEAERLFNGLPSQVRRKFANDPAEFLEFVQNPENRDEMAVLGLLDKGSEAAARAPEAPESPTTTDGES